MSTNENILSFNSVAISPEGINTSEFLEATKGLVSIFDLFGTVFGVVQNDMNGNIKKIRERYDQNHDANSTLQKLVEGEVAEKKKNAIEGLLWLTRGLDFTLQSLKRNEANPDEALSESFVKGYEATLKQYHGIFVRPIFTVAMNACPKRADFYTKLAEQKNLNQQELSHYLAGLSKIVGDIQSFYAAKKL